MKPDGPVVRNTERDLYLNNRFAVSTPVERGAEKHSSLSSERPPVGRVSCPSGGTTVARRTLRRTHRSVPPQYHARFVQREHNPVATDYDAPRSAETDDDQEQSLEALKARRA